MSALLTYQDAAAFEKLYSELNEKEGRVYTDEQVKRLPQVSPGDRHYKEWTIRKNSLKRLLHYIKQKRDQQHILEVGCGNGWLAAQLASHTGNIVTGIDICSTAIEQAQRVFDTIPHLDFIPFDFNNEIFEEQKFDLVIIAASAGYFHSFKKMIAAAMEHLTLQGEIHILDSALYRQHEIAAVKEQAGKQLQAIDMNAIAPFYFYHSIDELKKYNHTVLYDPNSWMNRLMHQSNPFYHIIIKNRYQ